MRFAQAREKNKFSKYPSLKNENLNSVTKLFIFSLLFQHL